MKEHSEVGVKNKEARHEPAHTKISRTFGVSIVTGDYKSGDILPSEIEIAQGLGVSRSVVREALRMLAARGLIDSKPRAGTRVKERSEWNVLDPILLEWMFDSEPSLEFVRDLFELRMVVEPAAAELAAQRKSARQLSAMGHALEMMAEHTLLTPEGQVADQQFHSLLLEATNNALLINLSASIGAAVRWTTFYKFRKNKHPRDPIQEHRDLFEAIAQGDGAQARLCAIKLIEQAEVDTAAAIKL